MWSWQKLVCWKSDADFDFRLFKFFFPPHKWTNKEFKRSCFLQGNSRNGTCRDWSQSMNCRETWQFKVLLHTLGQSSASSACIIAPSWMWSHSSRASPTPPFCLPSSSSLASFLSTPLWRAVGRGPVQRGWEIRGLREPPVSAYSAAIRGNLEERGCLSQGLSLSNNFFSLALWRRLHGLQPRVL